MIKKIANRVRKQIVRVTNQRRITGHGNKIDIPSNIWMKDCKIEIVGDNNLISVAPMVRLDGVKFYIEGSNNVIRINRNVIIGDGSLLWMEDKGCEISIDEGSTFGSVHLAATEDGSSIQIGKDCMFSNDIDVRTGDSHSIINLQTGERTNRAKDVVIGNHVWCGAHSSILKGANIPNDVVIATRSIVVGNMGGGIRGTYSNWRYAC